MPAGAQKKSPNRFQRQRNGLLAIVHIAPKQLGFSEEERVAVLLRFGVKSSGALSIPELQELKEFYEALGFEAKPGKSGGPHKRKFIEGQLEALRERVLQEAAKLENGEERMLGLLKAKAGVDRLEWVSDTGKLRQIIRVLTVYRAKGMEHRA